MSFLLNPRVLIALVLVAFLAFSHLTAYRKGAGNVKQEWLAAVSAANSEARALEQARQRRADEAAKIAAARESRIRADAVRAGNAANSLRDTLSAVERNAASSLQACTASVAALRAVHGSCVEEYRSLGQEAAGHASDSLNLQDAWPE